jgi:hypothetical protein
MMTQMKSKARPLFDPPIVRKAMVESFRKLDPRHQVRNPVMFVVEVGSVLTTGLFVQALLGKGEAPAGFILAVSAWLWFTVVFANFAESMAEGRGKAQAEALRRARRETNAKKLAQPQRTASYQTVAAGTLRKGDMVLVEAGEFIPGDGEVLEGVASVLKTEEAVREGLFGTGKPTRKFLRRVGNLMVLPHGTNTVWFRYRKGDSLDLKGHHGGLSKDEMVIPFAAAKVSDLQR